MVRDEQDGTAELALQFLQTVNDLYFERGVERGSGFIGNQQRGFGHQRHRDRHSLAHATGKVMRITPQLACGIGNSHPLEHHQCARIFFSAAGAAAMLDIGHLPADGQHRIQAGHGVLEDHGYLAAAHGPHGFRRQGQQVPALEVDSPSANAGIRSEQPYDRGDQGGLAAAAFADDADDLSFRDGKTDMPQRLQGTSFGLVADRQVLDVQHRLVH